jgi:hypothetical protein
MTPLKIYILIILLWLVLKTCRAQVLPQSFGGFLQSKMTRLLTLIPTYTRSVPDSPPPTKTQMVTSCLPIPSQSLMFQPIPNYEKK